MRAAVLVFWLSGFLAGCSDQASQPTPGARAEAIASTRPVINPAKLEAAKAAIRAEPKVIDFVYDPEAVVQWTIGVKDDGSPRYGFAEYFCTRLGEWGVRTSAARVRIVDIKRYMKPDGNGRNANLGTVDCSSGEQWPD